MSCELYVLYNILYHFYWFVCHQKRHLSLLKILNQNFYHNLCERSFIYFIILHIRNPKSFSATEAEDEAAGGAGEWCEGAGGGESSAGGGQGCRLPVNGQPPTARLSGLEVRLKISNRCGIYIVFIKFWFSKGFSFSLPSRADHGGRVWHEAHRGGGQRGGGGGGGDIKQFWFPW